MEGDEHLLRHGGRGGPRSSEAGAHDDAKVQNAKEPLRSGPAPLRAAGPPLI